MKNVKSMKNMICSAVVLLAVLAGGHVYASEAMKAIVGSYLDIQGHLATDKIDGIKPAAEAIAEQASHMGSSGEPIASAAKRVGAAADLKAARVAFGDLSDAVIAAGEAEGWKDVPDVRVAYCPMVKKSWVQKDAEIRNPYYGKAMSGCGEFKKK